MRALILPACLVLAAFSPAQAQNSQKSQKRWKEIGHTSSGNVVSYDARSLTTAKGITSVTLQVKFTTPTEVKPGVKWYSSRHEAMFDCAKRKVASKSNTYYGDPSGTKVVQRDVIRSRASVPRSRDRWRRWRWTISANSDGRWAMGGGPHSNRCQHFSEKPRRIKLRFGFYSGAATMKKIWLTTDGRPHDSILGLFTTQAGARRYRDLLVERYSLGKNLSLAGQPLAHDADAWRLGLGPDIVERTVDGNLDFLRGAWVVKVDESCRMIACEFSTKLKPNQSPATYRVGIHRVCQAHAATPQAALDAARKAMVAHLGHCRT